MSKNSGGGEIKIQDLIINRYNKKIPDVFGSYPPEFSLHPWLSTTESPDRKHLYVSTVASGILMFERIGVDLVEIPAAEDWILRLDPLSVSDNRVEFGSESAEDGCLTVANITIDDVSYTLEDSKWQERDLGTSWVDIQGSEEAEQVCSRKLEETKEYRVVVTMAVDGTSGTYASNFMGRVFYERLDELEVSSTQIDLAALTISSCQGVSDLTLNGTKYTVETSQWQVRNDSEDDWEDIESTRKSRELCTYSPQDDREYRLVGTFLIDDVRGYYHSNIISN